MHLTKYYPTANYLLQEHSISITTWGNKTYNRYYDHLFNFKNESCSAIVLNGKLHGKLTIEILNGSKEIWFNRGVLHRNKKPAYIHKKGSYNNNEVHIENGLIKDITIHGERLLDPSFVWITCNGKLNKSNNIPCKLCSFNLSINFIKDDVYVHEFDEDELNYF